MLSLALVFPFCSFSFAFFCFQTKIFKLLCFENYHYKWASLQWATCKKSTKKKINHKIRRKKGQIISRVYWKIEVSSRQLLDFMIGLIKSGSFFTYHKQLWYVWFAWIVIINNNKVYFYSFDSYGNRIRTEKERDKWQSKCHQSSNRKRLASPRSYEWHVPIDDYIWWNLQHWHKCNL